MDSFDQKIIAALQKNARQSVSSIAEQVNLSRTAVSERIKRLEATGEILGYQVLTGSKTETGNGLKAYFEISHGGMECAPFVQELMKFPEVQRCHGTSGDVDLLVDISDSVLGINQLDVMFGTSGSCTYDNDPSDGCLRIEAGVIAGTSPVVNQVDITATLPAVTGLANVLNDSAGDTCDVEQGGDATRTLGFWKSHGSDGDRNYPSPVQLGYTCHIARDHVGFPINLGWKTLHSCADVFGIFWSNMGKQSDGDRRTQICRTKLHSSWQLMAAILNDGLSNGATVPTDPDSGLSLIDAMVDALSGNNRKVINKLQGQLDDYNNSGDDVSIEDADGAIIPPADPNGTRDLANYEAGDC